jgi:hypothetical protein
MFDTQSFPIPRRIAPSYFNTRADLYDGSYNLLTHIPIVGPVSRPTMGVHIPIEEAIMPSKQDDKSKGMKGMGEAGNQQSAGQSKSRRSQGKQQNSDLASGPGDNAQRGDWGSQQSGNPGQGNQSQSDLGSGPGDNSRGQGRQGGNLNRSQQSDKLNQNQQSDNQRGNLQSGGQGSRTDRNQLDRDDLDSDDLLQR